jgi:two-component system, chemotaxis family, chemotaxis protein CheY
MRILIVDDSLTIRSMIRRSLADMPGVDMADASNGMEALAQITRRRFDLVVLDMNMPLMDGLETLEAIRASPDYAALPVVMLTSEKSEALVRRLVELRITDFLNKPLTPEILSHRFPRLIARLAEGGRVAVEGESLGHRMLIVEQDPDRRHFLVSALTGRYKTTEADSAAAALQICVGEGTPRFEAVLIGPHVGLPPVEMFVAKLRSLPGGPPGRLIGLLPKGTAASDPRRLLFDAVMESSAVPEIFHADLARAMTGQQTPLARLLLVRPTMADDVVSATEQMFGLMLSCEVIASTPGPPRKVDWPGECVMALINLETDDHAKLNLLFRATRDAANAIAGGLIGVAPTEVEEADVLASAAELVNIVHGRLRNRLVDAEIQAKLGLPKTWVGSIAEAPQGDPEAIGITISAPALAAEFDLVLSAEAAAEVQ